MVISKRIATVAVFMLMSTTLAFSAKSTAKSRPPPPPYINFYRGDFGAKKGVPNRPFWAECTKIARFCDCECEFPSQAGNHGDVRHTPKQRKHCDSKVRISIASDCDFVLQFPSENPVLSGEFRGESLAQPPPRGLPLDNGSTLGACMM